VNPTTLSRLLELNRQFYLTFALQFSTTRQRLQPGVMRILEQIGISANVLDLGCGNGELARQLARRGSSGAYTGFLTCPAQTGFYWTTTQFPFPSGRSVYP
jgi:SAM-dependent methyltransferase